MAVARSSSDGGSCGVGGQPFTGPVRAGQTHCAISGTNQLCHLQTNVSPLSGSGKVTACVPDALGGGSLRSEGVAIVNLNYKQFMWLKRHDPLPWFDWSSDGCSNTPPAWANLFDSACQLHDFAYRNFGKGLKLGRTEQTRAWIDHRLLTEMDRICQDKYHAWYLRLDWLDCRATAWTMYGFVRNFSHW